MKIKSPITTSLLAVTMLGLFSCSSKPQVKEFPKNADAEQELLNFRVALDNASQKNVALLAPENFTEAREYLSEAEELKDEKADDEKILKEIAQGRAYLSRAEKLAAENENSLRDVVVARSEAMKAQAHILYTDRFTKIDKEVREETIKLENDKYSGLKEKRPQFLSDYKTLELAAIKKNHIGDAEKVIKEAEKDGAKDITPKTYAEAMKAYKAADLYITKNRYDTDGIAERAVVAEAAAMRLEHTLGAARRLEKSSSEETALRMQMEEDRLSKTQSALKRERGTSVALAADNIALQREKELDRIYEEARAKFSPEEAEVYKQGKNLVIRLRGIAFQKNKSELKNDNFALLRKVDDVIASFGKSAVTIEGHTDSSGGRQLNQRLSDERAEAVMKYLEANTESGTAAFSAKGFGYDRPLASNKSTEGRAQNRRVDVIIEPAQL